MTEAIHLPCLDKHECGSSDAYSWNNTKGQGYCHACELKTWLHDDELWAKRGSGKGYKLGTNNSAVQVVEDFVPKGITESKGGAFVGMRGITSTTMEKFNVKTGGDKQHYIYPSGGIKTRYISAKDFSASNLRSDELFGMNLFPINSSKIVTITEGELDTLSAWQMLSQGSTYTNPVVSLPSATPSGKLWEKCKGWLDSFEKIILSVDNDDAGRKVAERISLMFPRKVFVMNHGNYKDANDFLQAGDQKAYKSAWWGAKAYRPDDMLVDADDYLKLFEDSPDFEYFTTGIPELDEKILGINKGYFTVIQAPTGVGKSLAPETPVLKVDGTVVRADEVVVGDQLMGPDSKPRNVTNVNLQYGPMFRVTPTKGDSFTCNADHILSLKHTSTDEVKNVVLTEYLTWSKTQKHLWKLWRTEVYFPMVCPNTPSFAYAVGVYLGDGRVQGPELCMGKPKQSVIDYLMDTGWLTPTRMKFVNGAYYIGFSTKSKLWDYVSNHTGQTEDCLTVRKIPDVMKRGYTDTRKAVLAGLLDTDGSVTNGGAEITQKSEVLANDICFVARSLGLAAYKKSKWVNGAEYFRVHLSGDMTGIPCKRLKFIARKQIKSVLKTGFTVEPIGDGMYRGIALDGDHLFLLGDFTVTHNTEVMRYLEWRCLTTSEFKFAKMHLEESKLRGLLGLVSYDLRDNLTLKKFVDEKGRQEDVKASIERITEGDRMIDFSFNPEDGYEVLLDKIKYMKAAFDVDYVFFEPIQDLVHGDNKEGQLADLASRLGTMATDLGVGIVTIAHQNKDGDTMYASMIGKKAAFEILLARDQDTVDLTERNRTYIKVGRKNRVGLGNGPAGALDFDLDSYTLKVVEGPQEPKTENKGDF